MNRNLFLIAFLLLCRMVLYCQADSVKPEPYVYFNAFSVTLGFGGTESQSHTPDYFKQMAPGNSVVQMVPSDMARINTNGNTGNVMFHLGANIHLKTRDFKTKIGIFSSEWRVGLNIATSVREGYTLSREITQRTDTFYSNHTDMVKYEGKVSEDIYQYKYRSKNAYLDISKTYHSNQLKRWSFYTGINVGLGYTFANSLSATYVNDSTFHLRRRYDRLEKRDGAITETTKLGSEMYYNATIPVGVVLRKVSKRKEKAYPFSIFAEARLGYRFQKDQAGVYQTIPFGAIQIGAKINFKSQKMGQ
jgi:hypothetical protein